MGLLVPYMIVEKDALPRQIKYPNIKNRPEYRKHIFKTQMMRMFALRVLAIWTD